MIKTHMRLGAALVVLVLFSGCQTRFYATKEAEQIAPIQTVVQCNGQDTIITTGYIVASGGWTATARFPLWADERFSQLGASVSTNGFVDFGLKDYHRDLSANAVALTKALCDATAEVTAKVCSAIVSHGGTVAAANVGKLVANYLAQGGNAATAVADCADGSCTITDTATGLTCTDGACSP